MTACRRYPIVLKRLFAAPQDLVRWAAKLFIIPFFCVHYGMFTLVHGVFVIGFFGGGFKSQGGLLPSVGTLWQLVTQNHLEWPFLGLALSHGISFVHNYLWLGEYQQAKLQALMAQPYGRVVVLHLTILGGGFLMMALHSPRAGLVVLVEVTWPTLELSAARRCDPVHAPAIPIAVGCGLLLLWLIIRPWLVSAGAPAPVGQEAREMALEVARGLLEDIFAFFPFEA